MFRKALLGFTLLLAPVAQAAEVPPAMSQYIYDDLMAWVNDAEIVQAIQAQNSAMGALSQDDIILRDEMWRAQVSTPVAPLVNEVMNAPLSTFLRVHQEKSAGLITEVFVMDRNGLNVAASTITSDYWQGDEAKFQETFGKGSGSVFVDEIELDESTQTYQGQVSFAVTDPASGEVVGAITVGLNASAFY
ncbi:hypothetical protein Z946_3933 [Sulfitobacter noctilucicola]|uniref:Uncharacterized protein n=1 Tax=Sulfitobacter noctilucicola TaxID=1342301 RepID=A0A7W6Q364_9RHOB|nr:hypothetical protein [Sulfitobacter noctilucicola]KIN65036.1 hypothetical protein Z946_3933 [Sulfitobacter noctilucicola]MBB4173825.1 hypothetical protein [Sulfitobacter noctilucicola]